MTTDMNAIHHNSTGASNSFVQYGILYSAVRVLIFFTGIHGGVRRGVIRTVIQVDAEGQFPADVRAVHMVGETLD